MYFHYKVATTLSLLLLLSFVFQLVALLSVPITSTITLCTYDGYKFGVFGLCSTSTNTCSHIEIGYSKTTIEELQGFSLPSNTRHSISTLLIVHPISTGFTFILLVMSVLTHFKMFNRSLRFLFLLLLWCFVSFLLCLLSFLVDILLFIPHLDWGGWIVLASTVLIAISGTVVCIMRRTASSRNAYDSKKVNQTGNVEMYSMLPLKESYGYVRDGDYANESKTPTDTEDEDENEEGGHNADRTTDGLLYADEASTQPTDFIRNDGNAGYRGYDQRNNNNLVDGQPAFTTNNIINDEDEDGYYDFNPMSSNERFTRTPRSSLTLPRNSIVSQPPPGRASLPYPIEETDSGPEDAADLGRTLQVAPYPITEEIDTKVQEEQEVFHDPMTVPTIPRIDTPPMEEQDYQPQPVKVSPLKGPRPLPEDGPALPAKIPLEEEEEEEEEEEDSDADQFIFKDSKNISGSSNAKSSATHGFMKPLNNNTQTSLATTTNSTVAHKNFNNLVGENHHRFVSNSSTVPASSYYGDLRDSEEPATSAPSAADKSAVDESDESQEDEIPSSEYLEFNEENLSSFNHRIAASQLSKKHSTDSIASSNFTSISQRPVNPKYYEGESGAKRSSIARKAPHTFRAQGPSKSIRKEEKLRQMRERLKNVDV